MRRYPHNLADFAFDLFVGKPALVVEHHGYFRQGYEKIREFTTQLNSLSPKLRWMGLGELVRHTYLQRSVSPDTVECRIFANRQILDNPAPRGKSFIIYKPEGNEIPIGEVAVNGKQHPYFAEHDHMRLCVDVPASSETEVTIKYAPTAQYASNSEGQSFRQQAQVYLRRYLSTVRDNYLSKHDKLSFAGVPTEGRKAFRLMSASTQETLCQPVVGTVHTNSLSCEFGFSEPTHLCSLQRGTVRH